MADLAHKSSSAKMPPCKTRCTRARRHAPFSPMLGAETDRVCALSHLHYWTRGPGTGDRIVRPLQAGSGGSRLRLACSQPVVETGVWLYMRAIFPVRYRNHGFGRNRLFVLWIYGTHQTVPKEEIETIVVTPLAMVCSVCRRGVDPTAPAMGCHSAWIELTPAMTIHVVGGR